MSCSRGDGEVGDDAAAHEDAVDPPRPNLGKLPAGRTGSDLRRSSHDPCLDGEGRDGETSFKVNGWRGQAEHLVHSLSRGDRVMVAGRLRQRTWETPDGEKRSVAEIEADEVGASLKWAMAKVERASERGPSDRSQGRERQAERGGDFKDSPPF